jgi:hypothetical protein
VYLVLSAEERAKGFVRPVPRWRALSETYARDPKFYGGTCCVRCAMHRLVAEFRWIEADGSEGPTSTRSAHPACLGN